MLRIDAETMYIEPERTKPSVRYALEMLYRDHETVFRSKALVGETATATSVMIRYAAEGDACPDWPEAFAVIANHNHVEIVGRDELGLIYGILHFSRHVLGVDPFWFWADMPPQARDAIERPEGSYLSERPKTRFRGWFVNDEVCLIGWSKAYPPTKEVWLPVFEALLRCGGNMVIPGTDLPKSGIHAELASEMGLWITHHHAEPLGAEMFLRAYEGLQASYHEHPQLFEALWAEAIEKQKDRKVVWVLSFRGQGDKPFWENDPSFDTPQKRGRLIGHAVRRQYEMIREKVADPVCCMAMYGEIAELYKQGHIDVPKGVILVWADNGYGKMVSRRHGNVNHRIPALPTAKEGEAHGIYYHVTFHDLQASNHLTLFPSPVSLIREELESALTAQAHDYWLINSGNIRQHLYTLDFIAEMWGAGSPEVEDHRERFIARLFPESKEQNAEIGKMLEDYAAATIRYGFHKDDKAGDEFYHHPARRLIGHWLRGELGQPDEGLLWVTGDVDFDRQVIRFEDLCKQALPAWASLAGRAGQTHKEIDASEQQRFEDHLLFHIRLHDSGCRGFHDLCRSYRSFRDGDSPAAFVYAVRSLEAYREGLAALNRAEYGKWKDFYSADYLTNVASTVNNVETVVRFLRMHGDSPDFFQWYKQFLMPETEKYIYLENTHRRVLPDEDLARRLDVLFTSLGRVSSPS